MKDTSAMVTRLPLGEAALLRGHGVEPLQIIELILLRFPRQLAKAGFVLQLALLLGGRQIAMVLHPLLKMRVLILLCSNRGALLHTILFQGRGVVRLAGESRPGEQQNERRAESEPG
jgi:hypothetical protein